MSHEVESESSEHERQSDEEAEPKGRPRDRVCAGVSQPICFFSCPQVTLSTYHPRKQLHNSSSAVPLFPPSLARSRRRQRENLIRNWSVFHLELTMHVCFVAASGIHRCRIE